MASWKERFTYNSKSAVEHEVNGNTLRFYPNRIGLLTELAEISKPIAHALATLFSDNQDRSSSTENHKEGVKKDKAGVETAAYQVEKITVNAVSPETADHRKRTRDAAIDELIDSLTNERNKILFGRLLMDSLREEFGYKKDRPVVEVEHFLEGDGEQYEGLDAPMMAQLVGGWLKANAKVFGSTGEKMAGLVRGKLELLRDPSMSGEMTKPADGSNSKIPSSAPSDTDSE